MNRNFMDSERAMLTVSVCDILSVSSRDSQHKKVSSMPRQSSRIKDGALNKIGQNDATHAAREDDCKMKNGYDVKTFYSTQATIDILSEMKNNSARKRKANFKKKTDHGSSKQDGTKQIKTEAVHKKEDEENSEFEYGDPEESNEGMSEYEKMCQRNIEEKMAFFASLNFEEVKQGLVEASASVKIKKQPQRLNLKEKRPTSVRKSLRLQRISPEGQPMPEPAAEPEPEIITRKPHEPLTFQTVFQSRNQNSEQLIEDMSGLSNEELKFDPVTYDQYMLYCTTMKVKAVAKVSPARIYSVAIHPSLNKTLICAGSVYGHLSFWDVNYEWRPHEFSYFKESKNPEGGIYVYAPHSAVVNCIAFNESKPHQIISVSYDGTGRCGDLESGIFYDIFHTSDEDYSYDIRATSFDFLSPDSVIISLSSGKVAITDMRTPSGQDEKISHELHPCPIKTVSVHPVKKDYFITAGRNGVVSLWDTRFLKKKSIADMVLTRSVNSAYFSPVTGNSVLTTSMDNKLCVFDTAQLQNPLELKTSIRHDNFTGRWLTQFRAVWLPNNEEAFIVGSMQHPRRIEVFQTSGRLAYTFIDEELASVCSINAFHPSKPVLAGGNSSGKLHVFRGKE